jgi:branched-chain amino acid transport system ATP-binding protein
MLINVKDLSVKYGAVLAVRKVSLKAESNNIAVLVGANGAGKSSLIRCIMGLVPADTGEIWLGDCRIDGLPPYKVAEFAMAIVPEGRRLFANMTVVENLYVGAHRRNVIRKEISSDLNEIWDYFPVLQQRRHQVAGSLSGGEQQMLAIGRALMVQPETLLMDEPSLGLAPIIVQHLAELIVRLKQERGLTILMAEQNARMGFRLADYAFVLENGKVALEGRGQELAGNDYVKSAYLGGK